MTQSKKTDTLFAWSCVTYIIILLCFVMLRISGGLGFYDKMPDWFADVLFSFLSQIIIMLIIPVIAMYTYKKRTTPKTISFNEFVANDCQAPNQVRNIFTDFGFRKLTMNVFIWAVVLGCFMFLFNIFVSSFFNGILTMIGHRGAGSSGGDQAFVGFYGMLIVLVLSAVLPGFCEEVAHRGLLMQGFKRRLGIHNAILLSSLLFGLMHLNIIQFFYATILGYLMAMAAVAMRNIWVAVIIHFMNNGLSTYLMYANQNGWFGGNFFTHLGNFVGGMNILVYGAMFIGLYFLIVAIIHGHARMSFIEKYKNSENPPRLYRGGGMNAIKYYITFGERRDTTPLNPKERALIYSIVFLGAVITIMTFAWGML